MSRSLLGSVCAVALAAALTAPAAAQVSERHIRVSNGVNQEHPNGLGVAEMASCAAEKSGGVITITGFWGGALGGDLEATQALRSGTQEMVVTSSSPLVGIVPELGVFDLPFLIGNEAEADALLDGAFGDAMSAKLEAAGLVNLAYWENGFRNTTNSRHPITRWEDFEGVKMRVMQNPIFLDTFSNMGANAVPMAFGEVFSALETGAIDGQENPFVTIQTSKFNEVQDYLSVTRHAYTPFLVLFSKPIWDTYSAEEQQILSDCAVQARTVQRQANRDLNAQAYEELQATGMAINELTPEEVERIRERAQPIYANHAATIGQETIDQAMAALEAIRAAQ